MSIHSLRRRWLYCQLIAWVLCFFMAATPISAAFADAFNNAAHQGQTFGRGHIPNPESVFHTNNNGDYVLSTGHGQGVVLSPESVFGTGPGNANDLKHLAGSNQKITKKLHKNEQYLQTDPSGYGKAYRTLVHSSQRTHPDISNKNFWDLTTDTMKTLFGQDGEFSACKVTQQVISDHHTVHVPDYRTCEQLPMHSGTCTIKHEYDTRVIKHVSGPLNIDQCVAGGSGCRVLWLGRRGDNYWNHENYQIHDQVMKIQVIAPQAITSVKLDSAWWDDHSQLWIDGNEVWWSTGSQTFPPDHASCNVNQYNHGNPDLDLTRYFKNVPPGTVVTLNYKTLVCDRGEGYAHLTLKFNPDKALTHDQWTGVGECQSQLDALSSGFGSGGIQCTDMPDQTEPDCVRVYGNQVCLSQLKPSPVPGVSRLCRQVKVTTHMTFNHGPMPCWTDPDGHKHCPVNKGGHFNTCGPYENNPQCVLISSQCTLGAEDANGNCYDYTDRYDCGADVPISTLKTQDQYSCPGGIRCEGTDCIDVTQENNNGFGHAAAILQAGQAMMTDMNCPTNQSNDIDPDTCKVFIGQASTCKIAVGGEVNCCKEPDQGVSLRDYITLLQATQSLGGFLANNNDAFNGVWSTLGKAKGKAWGLIKDGWDSATNTVTDAMSQIDSPFASNLDASSGSTPTHIPGLSALKETAMKQTAKFIAKTFGKQTAGLLFQEAGGGGLYHADGTMVSNVTLGGPIGAALGYVMMAYMIYVVAKILIHMIWKCEKSEFELGAKRKLKSAHYVGTYCNTKALGVCIEKIQSYCTFNSPLSRILQEQVRKQLDIGWGSPKDPDCDGLSIADINRVDWNQIDLSEWLGILQSTGHMPSNADQAKAQYAMKALTGTDSAFNFNGKRKDTKQRNIARLDNPVTDQRNETLRQDLWEQKACPTGGSYQASNNMCVANTIPVCPVSGAKAVCLAQPTGITCPNESQFSASTQQCVADATGGTCPMGLTFNADRHQCTAAPVYQCPADAAYDPARNACVSPATGYCPAGLHEACISDSTPDCPSGSHYNPAKDQCVKASPPVCHSGSHFDSRRFQCVKNSPPICKHGSHYSRALDRCIKGSPPICHHGTHFNGARNICVHRAGRTCAVGTLSGDTCYGQVIKSSCAPVGRGPVVCNYTCDVNGAFFRGHVQPPQSFYDNCHVPAQPTCPSGTHYNSSHRDCTLAPTHACPSGMHYSGAHKQCEAAPGHSCPAGMHYQASDQICVASADHPCPSGTTYDSGRKACVAPPTFVCSNGGTFDPKTRLCTGDASFTCPEGMSYDASRGYCTAPADSEP